MKFEIHYHELVKKIDLPLIDAAVRIRVKKAIETKLMIQPARFGKPLRGSLRGSWKLRVGDYRILFTVKERMVKIYCIRHRAKIYKDALARLVK